MTNKPDALPVVAEPCIECWCCHVPVTLDERSECDGQCPHCDSELVLDDYLSTAVLALDELRNERDTLQAELAAMRERLGRPIDEDESRKAYEDFYTERAKTLPLPLEGSPLRYPGGQYVNDFALFGWIVWSKCSSHYAAPSQVAAEVVQADIEPGVKRCVAYLENRASEYANDHGSYDDDTGSTEFRNPHQEDYYSELHELADAMRALLATSQGEA